MLALWCCIFHIYNNYRSSLSIAIVTVEMNAIVTPCKEGVVDGNQHSTPLSLRIMHSLITSHFSNDNTKASLLTSTSLNFEASVDLSVAGTSCQPTCQAPA